MKGAKPGQTRDFLNETIIWDITPEKTVLLVVDMQYCFCDPSGPLYVPQTAKITPKINGLAEYCRRIGIQVIWLREEVNKYPNDWKPYLDLFSRAREREFALNTGKGGAELYKKLERRSGDWEVVKNRYSPFAPNSPSQPNLDKLLRSNDKDTIIITGTNTNVCCDNTARDAMNLDYKVVFVSDATATYDDMLHEATLITMKNCYAMVCATDELIEEIELQRRQKKSAQTLATPLRS